MNHLFHKIFNKIDSPSPRCILLTPSLLVLPCTPPSQSTVFTTSLSRAFVFGSMCVHKWDIILYYYLARKGRLPNVSQEPAMLTCRNYLQRKQNTCISSFLGFCALLKAAFRRGHFSVLGNQSLEGIDAGFKRNGSSQERANALLE